MGLILLKWKRFVVGAATAAVVVTAVVALISEGNGGRAIASGTQANAVTDAQLASVGITVAAASGDPTVSSTDAESTAKAKSPFTSSITDARLATCQTAPEAEPFLCWIVSWAAAGDTMYRSGGPGLTSGETEPTFSGGSTPAFEATLIDATTGDYVTAVQSTENP
jgi:hypothetical protein